jgi:cell division inhibitor SulA
MPETAMTAREPAPRRAAVLRPVRSLQIEADGDRWQGQIKPKIRLTGRWLEAAGFPPGHRVQVTCVAPGLIELRTPGLVSLSETHLPPADTNNEPF